MRIASIAFVAAAVAHAAAVAPADADMLSADSLVEDCQAEGVLGRERQLACSGFLLGVINASHAEDHFNSEARVLPGFCIDDSVTPRVVREKFLAWVAVHPGVRGRNRVVVAIEAMREQFPC